MARYRLRLLLQEFDLPPGETLLGRSPECHVTIDDPLVSREHARVEVRGEQVFFHDLGSRNGSKVNGNHVTGSLELHDGDRLRIGNQELVFSRVVGSRSRGRPTGSLRHCRRCGTPYPGESPTCPNCGFSPSHDDTLSGTMAARAAVASLDRDSWTLQIHLELIDR
ncbi:MAG: FHA domain-containing protein, partial [Polyangiales bacterium]